MKSISREDLVELLEFLDAEGLLTLEDKVEIFVNKNIERLKSLAYIATLYIRKKLEEDNISQRKEEKYRRILQNLVKKDGFLVLGSGRIDVLEGENLEKIVGE